ncbi:hypothetical protein J5N97_013288 [Dioscorea zingiberensis]|uniref:Uncharacterized protein n=1 Tax=Dioscorea zingiberensis TaxID=325984 RepID=A0A9D5CRK5_9LILI|nr:hypothetical protein J5N97_013288 [Dioscorea zingiberensis]
MTLSHYAPWLIVVGASSTDKRYGAAVELGNGLEFLGETGQSQKTPFNQSITGEIIFPGANNKNETLGCLSGSLNGFNVRDKIVLCWSGKNNTGKGRVVLAAGGAAMILMGPGPLTIFQSFVLPMSRVDSAVAEMILNYYRSTRSRGRTPTATITYKGLVPGRLPAPQVAGFSSRGPSEVNGGILKPDVIAPGVEILAAWPNRSAPYDNYFSYDHGTSMAAPHVAGVMALIRKKYPKWSPAAIQSAIITSADDLDLSGRPIIDATTDEPANIFARGAGHINPQRAMDPGLVYDRNFSDYVGYLCALGCDSATMHMYTDRKVNCTAEMKIKASQLNYPSIMVTLSSLSPNETVSRTVTNVGHVSSVYTPRIFHPAKASVILSTNRLQFSAHRRQASFDVTIRITPPVPVKGTISEGKIEWVSNKQVVRSPIAVVFD